MFLQAQGWDIFYVYEQNNNGGPNHWFLKNIYVAQTQILLIFEIKKCELKEILVRTCLVWFKMRV